MAYHVRKCALVKAIEGELVMTLNEAPIIVNDGSEGTQFQDKASLRLKTPTGEIFHKIYDLHDNTERKVYIDQTGRFPIKPYRGVQ